MFEANEFDGTRRVIDISGDGANNFGRLVNEARDDAIGAELPSTGFPSSTTGRADLAGVVFPILISITNTAWLAGQVRSLSSQKILERSRQLCDAS